MLWLIKELGMLYARSSVVNCVVLCKELCLPASWGLQLGLQWNALMQSNLKDGHCNTVGELLRATCDQRIRQMIMKTGGRHPGLYCTDAACCCLWWKVGLLLH